MNNVVSCGVHFVYLFNLVCLSCGCVRWLFHWIEAIMKFSLNWLPALIFFFECVLVAYANISVTHDMKIRIITGEQSSDAWCAFRCVTKFSWHETRHDYIHRSFFVARIYWMDLDFALHLRNDGDAWPKIKMFICHLNPNENGKLDQHKAIGYTHFNVLATKFASRRWFCSCQCVNHPGYISEFTNGPFGWIFRNKFHISFISCARSMPKSVVAKTPSILPHRISSTLFGMSTVNRTALLWIYLSVKRTRRLVMHDNFSNGVNVRIILSIK